MPTLTPIALSAMHHRQVALDAVMLESDGWQRPARYGPVEAEVERVRSSVGLHDVSPVGKLILHGEDITSLLQAAAPDVGTLDIGKAARHQLKGESGAMDVILARLAADEALVLTGPGQAPVVAGILALSPEDCAHAVDVTSALAGLKVTGPLSHRLLASVTELNISPREFPNMTCAQVKVAEIHGTVLRRDLGGLTSYDLYVGREYGVYIWDALMEAGEEYGLVPFGTEAMESLRAQ
jgi:heterotetrameric sarcosine oxidase gamma subunit